MITESQLDHILQDALCRDAEEGIGSTVDLTARVRAAVNSRSTPSTSGSKERRSKGRRHAVLVLIAAVTALGLTTGAAFATSSLTSLIRIHWDHVPLIGVGQRANVTVDPPYSTTLADAQTRLGFKVQTLDGYAPPPTSVLFIPSVLGHGKGAISLKYTINGNRIEIVEEQDPNGPGPLDVNLKVSDQTPPGMDAAKVETIDGGQYLVFRSSTGGVGSIEWKRPDGVVMRINFWGSPPDTNTVVDLIQQLH